LECPRMMSMDVDDLRLLETFGETVPLQGLETSPCPKEGRETCAVTEGHSFISLAKVPVLSTSPKAPKSRMALS
jgi:hypothetical protein